MTEHKKHNNVGEKGKLLNEMHKKKNRVILTVLTFDLTTS